MQAVVSTLLFYATLATSGLLLLVAPFTVRRRTLHDLLSGRDVIVAEARAARPTTFATAGDESASTTECPFCPGEEAQTPPEVARAGGGERDQPGWQVRVNDFLLKSVRGAIRV